VTGRHVRQLREILDETDETLRALDLVGDRFTDKAHALVLAAVLLNSFRLISNVVEGVEG
jgi:hypothetical protein